MCFWRHKTTTPCTPRRQQRTELCPSSGSRRSGLRCADEACDSVKSRTVKVRPERWKTEDPRLVMFLVLLRRGRSARIEKMHDHTYDLINLSPMCQTKPYQTVLAFVRAYVRAYVQLEVMPPSVFFEKLGNPLFRGWIRPCTSSL